MNKKEKYQKVLSLLSEDDLKNQVILNFHDENNKIEEIFKNSTHDKYISSGISKNGGTYESKQDLLYKNKDNSWTIKVYLINEFLNS